MRIVGTSHLLSGYKWCYASDFKNSNTLYSVKSYLAHSGGNLHQNFLFKIGISKQQYNIKVPDHSLSLYFMCLWLYWGPLYRCTCTDLLYRTWSVCYLPYCGLCFLPFSVGVMGGLCFVIVSSFIGKVLRTFQQCSR